MTTMTLNRAVPATFILILAAFISTSVYLSNRPIDMLAPAIVDEPEHKLMSQQEVLAAIAAAELRRQELLRPDANIPNAELSAKWGVEVIGLSNSAGGRLVDFRYRVVDVEKALPLFDGRIKPMLINESNQARLPVPMFPMIGSLRTTNRGKNIQAGKIYTIMFGGGVKSGDKATIEIGNFRLEHLTVH